MGTGRNCVSKNFLTSSLRTSSILRQWALIGAKIYQGEMAKSQISGRIELVIGNVGTWLPS